MVVVVGRKREGGGLMIRLSQRLPKAHLRAHGPNGRKGHGLDLAVQLVQDVAALSDGAQLDQHDQDLGNARSRKQTLGVRHELLQEDAAVIAVPAYKSASQTDE